MLNFKQQTAIGLLVSNPKISTHELAAEVQVSESAVYRWKQKPEFRAELDRQLKEKWKDSEGIAMSGMISLAEQEDYKACKYILDSLGYAPAQKIDANVNQDINITVEE